MPEDKSREKILWFFLALFLISILFTVWLLSPFLPILILASVLTGIFNPAYRFLRKYSRASFASLLTCVSIFLILIVPLGFLVGILTKEAYDLFLMGKDAVISGQLERLLSESGWIDKANMFLAKIDSNLKVTDFFREISELGKIVGLFLFEQARGLTQNVIEYAVDILFMMMVIYFLLIDGDRLIRFIIDLSPLPEDEDEKLIRKFKDMAGAVLVGNGLSGIIQGTLGGVAFALFGLRSPFLWGVIMGILAFLPIIGIGAILIPTALWLMLKGRILSGIFFIVFYMILSFGTEYLFKPMIVGNQVRMHPLLVFLAIIGGLKIFGILGIIYGPLIAIGFMTMTDIYHSKYQRMVAPDPQPSA